MYKKAMTIARLSMRQLKNAYFITGIVMLAMLANYILAFALNQSGNSTVSFANMLIILPILSAIFIPAQHTRKILNLGAKRIDVITGALPVYIIQSAAVTLLMLICHYTFDRWIIGRGISEILDVLVVFGYMSQGPVVAFIRMFAFLLLLTFVLHTLTAAQDKWYGWVADIVIVAIISVFTPIASLRVSLVWFFNLIIFHRSALLQVAVCLVLGCLIYMLNKPILARKVI